MSSSGGPALSKHYDPIFTADISKKMRVPDRIGPAISNGVVGADSGVGGGDAGDYSEPRHVSSMTVPDKIFITGSDRSVGVRDLPDLHSDYPGSPLRPGSSASDTSTGHLPPVALTTPPHTLTLQDRSFPTVEDMVPNGGLREEEMVARGAGGMPPRQLYTVDSVEDTPSCRALIIADEDEPVDAKSIVLLRRHVSRLSRHVARLEAENSRRGQREMALYPIIIGYIFVSFVSWFMRR